MAVMRNIKYIRIASEIEEEIRKKNLPEGTPVYSVHDIMEKWSVSLDTANHALNLLSDRKVVCRVRGQGSFVCKTKSGSKPREYRVAYTICKNDSFKLQKLLDVPEKRLIDLLKANHCRLIRLDCEVYQNDKAIHQILKDVDGVVISAVSVAMTQCLHMYDLNIPVVLVHGDILYNLPFHQILPDPMTGLRQMFAKAKPFGFKGVVIVSHNHHNGESRAPPPGTAAPQQL